MNKVFSILRNIFATLLSNQAFIFLLEAMASKTEEWEWDDAVVRLMKAISEGDDPKIKTAMLELSTAIKNDTEKQKKETEEKK